MSIFFWQSTRRKCKESTDVPGAKLGDEPWVPESFPRGNRTEVARAAEIPEKIIPPRGYASRIFKYSMRHRIGAGVFECGKGGTKALLGEIINDPFVSKTFRKATTNARDNSLVHLRSFFIFLFLCEFVRSEEQQIFCSKNEN